MFYTTSKLMAGNGETVDDSSTGFTLTAAATTNATLIKAGKGVIVSITVINQSASLRYLRLYDQKVVPTAGAGTPVRKYTIPGSATGAGFVLAPMLPMKFNYGIGFTLTTGVADTDTTALTANDVVLTIEYI